METYMYLMSGSAEAAPRSYCTSRLHIVRLVSMAYTGLFGSFHFTPIAVTKNGKKVGYGIAYWKDTKLCLCTKHEVSETVKRFEKVRGNGRKTLEWWLIGTGEE